MPSNPVERALHLACDLLEGVGEPYHFYGAVAVAAWGDPRNTRDVDAVVVPSRDVLREIISGARSAGFFFDPDSAHTDLAVSRFTRFNLGRSNLDLFLGTTPFDISASSRRKLVRLFGREIPVVAAEDLVVYKLVAGRPRDLSDIESVLVRRRGGLDLPYMEEWVARIAADLGRPELNKALDRLLRLRYQ